MSLNNKIIIKKGLQEIELPDFERKVQEGWIDFEVSERTLDNTLVSDFIGFKRIFNISWNVSSGYLINDIIDLYLAKEDVILKIQQTDGSYIEYVCKIDISKTLTRDIEVDERGYIGFRVAFEEV